nr:MAG TPA: hypothetical protein [Caudoviricetes sp.]
MKLIDLLVQELPKRGGWKENWVVVTQDADGYFCCWRYDDPKYNEFRWMHITGKGLVGYWRVDNDNDVVLSCDSAESIVTKNQYESALAAAQKQAWNGEGVPPVGCECEAKYRESDSSEWFLFRCVGVDCGVAFGWAGKEAATLGKGSYEFRPLRTESERKRDTAIEAMQREADDGDNWIYSEYEIIYDAIAAGKIPGVKLED